MDKVQFNTQMVNMRKTVKRAKVQLIHHLSRQILIIRKKKGSGKQLVKNERRAGRLVKEIEVIKDLPCDEVTMSAIINKQSLQSVLDNASSTAEERGTARLIHHKLIASQVASFKDLVTDDLLEIGKRKEKLLSRTEEEKTRKTLRRGSESSYDEGDSSSEGDDGSESDGDNDGDTMNASPVNRIDAEKSRKLEPTSLVKQNQQLRELMESRHKKSAFFTKAQSVTKEKLGSGSDEDEEDGDDEEEKDEEEDDDQEDIENLEDLDDDMDEMGENFNAEFRELSAEFKKGRNSSDTQTEKERKKSKGLNSLFVGKLSGKSHDVDDKMGRGRKNRPGQKERQKINIKKQLDVLRRPAKKETGEGSRHVALVDRSSLDGREKQAPKRKVIPGINAPFEKPKTGDSAKEKLPPSQRPMMYPVSKRGRGGARDSGRSEGGGRTLVKAPAQTSEILHPSWEAKKKKKEQESKILPFAGKKITFDD